MISHQISLFEVLGPTRVKANGFSVWVRGSAKIRRSVCACRGLSSPGKDAVDGYVSLMLLPDKSKATKKKTAVKKRDLSPEFNER